MKDMTEEIFFADTYAIIEIIRGNPNYSEYTDSVLVTSKLNLMELYYHLLHDFDKDTAERYFKVYSRFVMPISNNSIRNGMQFKLAHKKEKVSYVDCVGYALALELGIRFLTGDRKFEDKDNVEFVK